jgi:hypothetical protein
MSQLSVSLLISVFLYSAACLIQIAKRYYGSPENAHVSAKDTDNEICLELSVALRSAVESLIQDFLWREEFFYIDE